MVKPLPGQLAIQIKKVSQCTPEQMRDRFECVCAWGIPWLFTGSSTEYHLDGVFLYSHRESNSVGLVFGLYGADKTKPPQPEMLMRFKAHMTITSC